MRERQIFSIQRNSITNSNSEKPNQIITEFLSNAITKWQTERSKSNLFLFSHVRTLQKLKHRVLWNIGTWNT